MQLHAYMRTAGLLLACARCFWLWLSGLKGADTEPYLRQRVWSQQRRRRRSASLRKMARAK
jgi:hypothetical protein